MLSLVLVPVCVAYYDTRLYKIIEIKSKKTRKIKFGSRDISNIFISERGMTRLSNPSQFFILQFPAGHICSNVSIVYFDWMFCIAVYREMV